MAPHSVSTCKEDITKWAKKQERGEGTAFMENNPFLEELHYSLHEVNH
jgi:hypothetical protein